MPIVAGNAPDSVTQLVDRQLAALDAATGTRAAPGANLREGDGVAVVHRPLPVFHIDMARLGPDSLATDATRVGWRYFVGGGADPLRTVDVHDDARSTEGGAEVTAITSGGAVDTLAAASAAAERATAGIAAGHYEARVLEFGRAGPGALWLHGNAGTADRFFSLDAEPRERTEAEVIGDAARIAALRRAPDGGGGRLRAAGAISPDESGG